jgi:GPH family glycoside/pentoside/hexuronide:cation symporter
MSDRLDQDRLSLPTQLAYGIGDLGPSMAGNTLMVFFFFFLTTIAGLSPDLAGIILLLSNGWSAVSTLVIGAWSDRTQSPWGRRRIWMFCSAPILGASFFLHWWVPSSNDGLLFSYYLIIALLFQTAGNAFTIPYGALVTDLSENHDEHIRLNGLRFGFSLTGCIVSLLLAQGIGYWIAQPQQQLLALGLGCAIVTIASIFCCCWGTTERSIAVNTTNNSTGNFQLKELLANRPLLFLVGIYAFSWLAAQITPTLLPYFIVNCLQLEASAIPTIVLVMQGTALLALLIWEPLSRQIGKKPVFCLGSILWALAELGLFRLQAGQTVWMYALVAVMGMGIATAYLIPSSMLPEVIDSDELETGQRREGLVYSILVFLQKGILAFGLFLVGQLLAWSGFQEAIPGPIQALQPESALVAIRLIVVAFPTLALLGSLVLLYFYPITKAVQQDTLMQLQQRRVTVSNSVN